MTDGVYNVKGAPEDVSLDHIIRAEKVNGRAQNGKWQCNAGDVLRYARIKNL